MAHEVVIPGRTVIPPEGLVTVEVRNANNGRLKHRVRSENAIMDWFKALVPSNGGRPTTWKDTSRTNGVSGASYLRDDFDPLFHLQRDTVSPLANWREPWWAPHAINNSAAGWLYGTDSAAAVDAATGRDIPTSDPFGEVTGGASMVPFAQDGVQLRRGTIVSSQSKRSWDRHRIHVAFASSEGNGVWRSVGIGSLINQINGPGLRVLRSTTFADIWEHTNAPEFQHLAERLTASPLLSVEPVADDPDGLWVVTDNSELDRVDVGRDGGWNNSTEYWDFEFRLGSSDLPGGVSSSTEFSLVDDGTHLWILTEASQLFRCPRPTAAGPLTPIDTYDLSGVIPPLSAPHGICTDGVDLFIAGPTDVYSVDKSTGVATSLFAHGLYDGTGTLDYASIMWDAAQELLWVQRMEYGSDVDNWGSGGSGSDRLHRMDTMVVRGFTKAGVHTSTFSTTPGRRPSGMSAMTSDGVKFIQVQGRHNGFSADFQTFGVAFPSMVSRSVLPADIVKTSAETLTVTYDFNFS